MNLTPFHAKYFAYELTKKSSSDSVQKLASVLVDAQVDLNPHQVEAALFAFRSPLSKGAILADEVGLGKTIEAGLVISQKWAERKRKVIIITPANLRKQWSQELLDKFFLPSVILEAKNFNEFIANGNLNPFDQTSIILCSYQFAKAKEAFLRITKWDLAVIDEAHRLRNVYKTGNRIASSIKAALDEAPKILLTATPLQNSLLELYGLVSIIDQFTFGDLRSFKSQYARVANTTDPDSFNDLKDRLKPICKRTLRRQVLEYIRYTNRVALVEEFIPGEDEQRLYDLVTEYLQTQDLFALPRGQRQLMTLILRKLLASSTFAISGTLEGLGDKLEKLLATNQQDSVEQLLSEDFESYDELRDEWDDGDNESTSGTPLTKQEVENIKSEIALLKEFETLAKSIQKNSKGEKLFAAIENGFKEMDRLGAPKKAIIFTESTRTQAYLRNLLETRGFLGKLVLFNGSNTDRKSKEIYNAWAERHKNTDKITGSRTADMRAALVDFFREEATIMIATEAAAEGINLQFCSLLINYDMPWNPQRIEQRIGRCHRYGQKFDVVVVNFLNRANAADVRVYELLRDKFRLFSGVFGASDEVLGSIESGIDFEKRIAKIYQECRTTEQIEIAFNELQRELEGTISNTLSQTRQQLLENFDEEVHEKLKINLRESKEYLSKYESWLWAITKYYLRENADYSANEHSFTLKNNPFSLQDIHPGPYRIGKQLDDGNKYRISHPLAQAIIDECKSASLPIAELVFDYTGSPIQISVLESLVGKSGWLKVSALCITSFETEEHILLAGITENGTELEIDQCARLFSLPVSESPNAPELLPTFCDSLNEILNDKTLVITEETSRKNALYFETEIEKLDNWGEDKRNSLKVTLKELDDEIKNLKKQAKLAPNLPEKLNLERQRKTTEASRDMAWREYDAAAKDIELQKDQLLEITAGKLAQAIETNELFTIKWILK